MKLKLKNKNMLKIRIYLQIVFLHTLYATKPGNLFETPKIANSWFITKTKIRESRRNKYFFEEAKSPNFERECFEDGFCDTNELKEIFSPSESEENLKKYNNAYDELYRQCYKYPCDNSGTKQCIQYWNNRECVCINGRTGNDCSENINECNNKDLNTCNEEKYNLICQDIKPNRRFPKTHRCICKKGFFQPNAIDDYKKINDQEKCIDINECQSPEACPENSYCQNYPGGFNCECNSGFYPDYSNDRLLCIDIDECQIFDKNSIKKAETENSPDSIENLWVAGVNKNFFPLELVNGTLINSVDFSKLNFENTCSDEKNEECVNTVGSYECQCKKGFELDLDTNLCSDIDECKIVGCPDFLMKCSNYEGYFDCACPAGYNKKRRGGGKQLRNAENNNYLINHDDSYCEDIDECSEKLPLHTCDIGNQECYNKNGGYTCCYVWQYYDNISQNCKNIDYCKGYDKCPENSHCTSNNATISCECNDGFENLDELKNFDAGQQEIDRQEKVSLSYTIVDDHDIICVDVDECKSNNSDENICSHLENSKCVNTIGSYNCLCKNGYKMKDGKCVSDKFTCGFFTCDDSNLGKIFGDQSCELVKLNRNECKNFAIENCGGICSDNSVCLKHRGTSKCVEDKFFGPGQIFELKKINIHSKNKIFSRNHLDQFFNKCAPGFEYNYNYNQCQDIDECQIDNGNCPLDCMNFYGSHLCYDYLSKNMSHFCHHTIIPMHELSDSDKIRKNNGEIDHFCRCFDSFELCVDGFSCFPKEYDSTDRANKKLLMSETNSRFRTCPEDQISFENKCYMQSPRTMTLPQAENFCKSKNGKIASINSRKIWFILGTSIKLQDQDLNKSKNKNRRTFDPYHTMKLGQLKFWINEDSDSDNAMLFRLGEKMSNSGLVANYPKDMTAVPPALYYVNYLDQYYFYCEI